MPQSDAPVYPAFLVVADIGLAGVLLAVAPVLGVLMAAVGLFVAGTVVLRVRGYLSVLARPEMFHTGR